MARMQERMHACTHVHVLVCECMSRRKFVRLQRQLDARLRVSASRALPTRALVHVVLVAATAANGLDALEAGAASMWQRLLV